MNQDAALVAVMGPTASGKSHLALELASRFSGEILNCDSLQMVRGFDIGTAKLPPAERRGIPHHFLDILDPDQQFAAGEYMRQGRERLHEVVARGNLPMVAGGTGFYLRALIDGLAPSPPRDAALRARLQQRALTRGAGHLHRLLERLDADAARAIHAHDTPKVIRALEVCLRARRPVTALYREGRAALEGFRVLKIGLEPPRALLYEKINQRAREMFEQGLLEEVKSILARGYATSLPPFQAHGYRQAVDYLEGRLTREEAIYHAQTRTRQYAKRQMTWFRKEAGIVWLREFGSEPALIADATRLVSAFLRD